MLSQFVFLLKIKNQMSFYPFILRKISVLTELILGHLRYYLTDVPPQPNSPPDNVFNMDRESSEKEGVINFKEIRRKSCPFLLTFLKFFFL